MPTLLDPPAARKSKFRVPRIPDHRELAQKSSPPTSGGTGVPPVSPAASNPLRAAAPNPDSLHSPSLNSELTASESLLFDYLTLSIPLPLLARRHEISLAELAERLESSDFQSLLNRLGRLAAQRARHTAIQTRSETLAHLSTLIATSSDPELIRKCATPLLRASDRALYPQRSRKRRRSPTSETTPAQSPPAEPSSPDAASAPPRSPVLDGACAEPSAQPLSPSPHPCCPSSDSR